MPIAKEVLRDGFTVVAVPGGYVSNAAVEQFGWKDLVEAGPDPVNDDGASTKDKKAPKGAAQKGA